MDENKDLEKKPECDDCDKQGEPQGGTGVETVTVNKPERKWYETPLWMLLAAFLTALVLVTIFITKTSIYLNNNPPRITWDLVHELAADSFTPSQWKQLDEAESNRRVDIKVALDANTFYVNVHGPFMSDEELATIRLYYSSFEKKYSLSSWEWNGKSLCGCDYCECGGECA